MPMNSQTIYIYIYICIYIYIYMLMCSIDCKHINKQQILQFQFLFTLQSLELIPHIDNFPSIVIKGEYVTKVDVRDTKCIDLVHITLCLFFVCIQHSLCV